MGMDSYFYCTSKKEVENYNAKNAKRNVINNNITEYSTFLKEKYAELKEHTTREVFEKVATKDEIKKLDDMYDELFKLDECEDDDYNEGDELFYWRKAWGLHWYIVEHCGNHENDNCERIYVTKDFIKKLVDELERHKKMSINEFNNPPKVNQYLTHPFAKDDYWDIDRLNATYDFFNELLASWDEDSAYYYYSWY